MRPIKYLHRRRKKEYITNINCKGNVGVIETDRTEIFIDHDDLKNILEHEGGDIRGRAITYDEETSCINIGRPHKFKRNEKSCKEGVKGFISR